LACDVRDEWRGLVADGVSPDEATSRIVSSYSASLADPDDRGVVVLALAVTQWKTGRLVESVRDAALEVIDSGTDLARWDPGAPRKAREKALAKARVELLSPQPPARKIAKRRLSETPFAPGDVISYEHESGQRFLFWIRRNQRDRGGEYSQAEVLALISRDVPGIQDAIRLPTLTVWSAPRENDRARQVERVGMILIDAHRIPVQRYIVIGNVPVTANRPDISLNVIAARDLDSWLQTLLTDTRH
jgi:hypothetical protein